MNNFKKFMAIVLSAILITGLGGCSKIEKAESALNSTMEALQEGDFVTAARYIENTDVLTRNSTFNTYKDNSDFTKAIFSKLSYKINSAEEIDSSTVKMNVDITNVNMQTIVGNAIGEMFSLALANIFASEEDQLSEEDMQNKMIEFITEGINSDDAETVTNTVDVNAVKTGGSWKIDVDNTVIDAVTGGLLSALGSTDSNSDE